MKAFVAPSRAIYFLVALCVVAMAMPFIVFAEGDTEPPKGTYPDYVYGTVPIAPGYMAATFVSDNVGVTEAKVYVDGKVVEISALGISVTLKDSPSGTSFQFQWDTLQVPNGTYKVQIQLKDAAGNTAWIMTTTGEDFVNYKINNAVPKPPAQSEAAPSTTTEATEQSKCNADQEEIDSIVSRIVNRTSGRLDYIDQVLNEVEKFYVSSGRSVADYDSLLSATYSAQSKADGALDSLEGKAILCNDNPSVGLEDFKGSLADARSAIADYRKSVQELIAAVHENTN